MNDTEIRLRNMAAKIEMLQEKIRNREYTEKEILGMTDLTSQLEDTINQLSILYKETEIKRNES